MSETLDKAPTFWTNLHQKMDYLYNSDSKLSQRFLLGLLIFDGLNIIYFIIAAFYHHIDDLHVLETGIGLLYLLEFSARIFISPRRLRDTFSLVGLADLIVIVSLLMPALFQSYSFMRVVRALRLLRSYHMLKILRGQSSFVRNHEEVVFSIINLIVFIFVITAVVYVAQVNKNPGIHNYFDALYFTIATLTTTGFGDITLIGTDGHILAVLIMFFGISLFLRLVQTIIRPAKIHYECPTCGLNRHDMDAIHCKHCGTVLHITTEGVN